VRVDREQAGGQGEGGHGGQGARGYDKGDTESKVRVAMIRGTRRARCAWPGNRQVVREKGDTEGKVCVAMIKGTRRASYA